tara:strand:+ start:256 stop:2013 length:1758 start_codon:yes stop_codon:yes gene_type:complete
VAAWLVLALSAIAHPISMSNAVANVREDEVLVELRIMLEDLVLFHSLKADSKTIFNAEDLREAAVKHDEFLLKHFTLRGEDGKLLKGEVERRDLAAIPDEGVPQAELMKRHAIFLMRYIPAKQKPKFLTVLQQFGGNKSVIPSIMDFMVLQKGIWTDKPTQLQHGRPHTIAIDWENPPTEAPKNWRELRKKREEEMQKRLGITSYTGLYSYIYLNDREVRHEILVPLLTFEKWVPVKRKNREFLEVEEQEVARKLIAEWFRERNPVEIDEIPVKAVLQRLQFFGLDINDFAQNAKPRRISAYQARLGIILRYPAKAPPKSVKMKWEIFNDSAPFMRSIVYDRNLPPTEEFFVKDQPQYDWSREGETPSPINFNTGWIAPLQPAISRVSFILIGIAFAASVFTWGIYRGHSQRIVRSLGVLAIWLLGAFLFKDHVPLSQRKHSASLDLKEHTSTLLQNIYRAWEYNQQSDIYDALAHSVTGKTLEKLFLQIESALRMQEQGGAISDVKEVRIVSIEPAGESYSLLCTWNVTGTVEHWGHIHTRENQYSARIKLDSSKEGRGRISAFEVTNEKRVRFETGLRMFDDN